MCGEACAAGRTPPPPPHPATKCAHTAINGRIPERCRVLDHDGLAAPGEFIRPGDVYINMQRPTNTRDPLPPVV